MDAPSALHVEDLVRSPALQISVLAGAGGLARPVSWAHVSELEDPTPWLLGSEVIMTTGIAVPRAAAQQRAYLERLDDAGVAALALSAQLNVPPLRDAFFEAADERSIPVLEVPLPVPFIAVSQEVASAVQSQLHQRLGAQLQVFSALRWLTGEDLSTEELFTRLERLSGYSLYLCTPQRRPLLPGVPVPDDHHASLLPGTPDAPPTVPGGYVLPVPAPGGPAGYLLAIEKKDSRPGGLAVVQHIATVAALQVTMARHQRETLRREGAETLAELLQDVLSPPTIHRRLARAGFAPADPLTLMITRGIDGPPDDTAAVAALERSSGPYLLLRRQQDLYALVSSAPEAMAALAELPEVHVGASRPFPPGRPLGVPRREALWAVATAADSGRTLTVYGDDAAGRWLPEDPAVLRALAGHVLDAALRYDSEHASSLVHSTSVWMQHNRRADEAARALHIHPNTLAYRLRRFGELTGRDLSSTSDFTEVWLALRAARHLGELSPVARG
jgi:PucR family transcriptional regulator, purine catabolism regulatory protein